MRSNTSALWNHFDRDKEQGVGICKYCNNSLSYRSTIGNLKEHLKRKHRTVYDELVADCPGRVVENSHPNRFKKYKLLWNYFEKLPNKAAVCKCCYNTLSYNSTSGNLFRHIKRKHPDAYETMIKQLDSDNEDEDPAESLKLSDVWSYFEQESDRQACCVVCRTDVSNDYEDLKAHLQEQHPKLLLQIMQDNEQNSDAEASNADDNETYTEIVYLEQDPQVETSRKKTPVRTVHKSAPKSPKKRQRFDSDDDVPIKKKKEETDELGAFLQYISVLLKKLTPDAFSKVQIEIINTILKANTVSETRSLNAESSGTDNVANVIPVSDLTTLSNLGHNYTITVAAKPSDNNVTNMDNVSLS